MTPPPVEWAAFWVSELSNTRRIARRASPSAMLTGDRAFREDP